MALERKDVRFKMSADMHAALTVIAEIAGKDIGEVCEQLVAAEVERKVHEANVLASKTKSLGLTGHGRA